MQRFADCCYNDACHGELIPGDPVVQVAEGSYWDGYITPTRGVWIGEWHEKCFYDVFPHLVAPQMRAVPLHPMRSANRGPGIGNLRDSGQQTHAPGEASGKPGI